MAGNEYESVNDYLAAQRAGEIGARARARDHSQGLPGATEGISSQIPARVVAALGDELTGLLHSKATIRFPLGSAVPTRLITRIAKLRAAR